MAVHYFTAATLNGYLATTDDGLEWLLSRDVDPDGPHGYNAFLAGMGALVMGGTTYRWLLEHQVGRGEPWPYAIPTWVFAHTPIALVEGADIRVVAGPPTDHIAAITASAGERDVWLVGGGNLAAQFAEAGLVDDLWVQFAPVVLAEGKPLLPADLELELVETTRNRDFVCTHYAVRTGAGTPPEETTP